MNAVEELKDLTTSLSLSSTEIGENICKNVAKIQVELLPLVDETHNYDPGRAYKHFKGF